MISKDLKADHGFLIAFESLIRKGHLPEANITSKERRSEQDIQESGEGLQKTEHIPVPD